MDFYQQYDIFRVHIVGTSPLLLFKDIILDNIFRFQDICHLMLSVNFFCSFEKMSMIYPRIFMNFVRRCPEIEHLPPTPPTLGLKPHTRYQMRR
jgi:hypothetical protein